MVIGNPVILEQSHAHNAPDLWDGGSFNIMLCISGFVSYIFAVFVFDLSFYVVLWSFVNDSLVFPVQKTAHRIGNRVLGIILGMVEARSINGKNTHKLAYLIPPWGSTNKTRAYDD